MALKSINPATGEEVASFEELDEQGVVSAIEKGHEAYLKWRNVSFEERAVMMRKAAEILKRDSEKYGKLMTLEMGKPSSQAKGEVEKCAWVCEFYAEKAQEFLASEVVETDGAESFVQYDPLGIVLAVMPWNYPFWQVFRALAPTLMAGNTMILKHASNVPQCGMAIEEICQEAGFPEGVFQYLPIGSAKVQMIIEEDRVKAATLTGSEYAGSKVGEACGREIKPVVLELGGAGPFIVFEDADVEEAAKVAVMARFQNCGQSCIASKRFIVMDSVYEEFLEKFKEGIESWKFGDPVDPEVQIGPLYAESGRDEIEKQVKGSVEMGARVVSGGKRGAGVGAFFEPTILADVNLEMPVMCEETFGPAAAVMKVYSEEEALEVANSTRFGLGSSVWTKDMERAKRLSSQLDFGAVFVNGLVKSDPRLPFGGVKKSGVGRELSVQGIREFVNVKTVWIK